MKCIGCFLFALVAVCTTKAQTSFSRTDLQKVQWLVGSWKSLSETAPFYEAWRFYNDSVLVNFSIEIKDGDTLIKESSAIMLKDMEIILGKPPVQWKATRITTNEMVLKNDTLRYSNTIIWLHTKDDHWFTILEHPKATVYYDMIRDAALDRKVEVWITQHSKKK